jgi:hypothetical protein
MQDKILFGFMRRSLLALTRGFLKKATMTCRSLDLILKDRLIFSFGFKKKHFID